MNLINTSILTAISTVIKVLSGFFINKLIAIYIGASGLAMIGQFQNFIAIIKTLSTGGIDQGVIKYTAEYRDNPKKAQLLSTALFITFISSLILGIIIIIFSDNLSQKVLNSLEYINIFKVFGITIIFYAVNALMLSILNGHKEIKKFTIVNISGSIISLIFTSLLLFFYHLEGALYALILNQSILFFITLRFVVKSDWFNLKLFTLGIDKSSAIKLGKFTFMTIVSAMAVPMVLLFIRNYIGSNIGWDEAGYWQGMYYISTMYLLIVTTSLGVYYLPKLSEIEDKKELKREILNGYIIIMPIVTILALTIYFFRIYIIDIAFTKEFTPMLELFKWQLIGDIIKIASWLLGYLMLAKAMTKVFIITEIIFGIIFALLSVIFLNSFGLVGVTYAFALNYTLYLIVMSFIFRGVFR